MYTSGTTGDPKGVVIKNEAFMAEVLSVDHIIMLTDRVVRTVFLKTSCYITSTIDSANSATPIIL